MGIYEQDRFYLDGDRITWMYHNPDAISGSQFVCNSFSAALLKLVVKQRSDALGSFDASEVFDDIVGYCHQELVDIGTPWYDDAKELFESEPDVIGECSQRTIKTLMRKVEMQRRKKEFTAVLLL